MKQPLARGAFTLIELLVVISIIAVLASMLLPAIGMVRRSAQTAACASGMRQIAMAGLAYSGDQGGLLPLTHAGTWGTMWPLPLGPYLDALPDNATSATQCFPNSIFWSCKASATGGSGKIYEARSVVYSNTMWITYISGGIGMNLYPGKSPSGNGVLANTHNWRLAAITSKSTRAFLADSTSYCFGADLSGPFMCKVSAYADWVALGWKYENADPERHLGRMNLAFYDGHVQTVPAATAYLTFYDPVNFK